ncbi:TPA: hypothetical protein SMO43_001427 [Pseudomonas aeruginosa]|nr:hypothetical protein [Pseudomonas aeruginosa]HEK0165993.1 hypothetical protein [Pseudomonas aeruginosa]
MSSGNAEQLRRARRNQAFDNTPASATGQCPLKGPEVAIFPVRYALDESPPKGGGQGPNPLPADWPEEHLPPLRTRGYTLRQLRDGWLYVWDEQDRTFHEYSLQGQQFTRHKWREAQIGQDRRHNPDTTRPYLLYPRRSRLRIAYSPVQWTWRLCELMRQPKPAQRQWMREVDLPGYCRELRLPHGGPLRELGGSVADILAGGGEAPSFLTTLLPTRAPESADGEAPAAFKPAFDEALVRGSVPSQDNALFVALDDPLALIDDLAMNHLGRQAEQNAFEEEQRQQLQTALAVMRLCGCNVEALIPTDIATDPERRKAYVEDVYALLQRYDEAGRGNDLDDTGGFAQLGGLLYTDRADKEFIGKWGRLPGGAEGWRTASLDWEEKRRWREDVRFDECRRFLRDSLERLERLQAHALAAENDLTAWLDSLAPAPEPLFHDPCNEEQSERLFSLAVTLHQGLANSESGGQWLCRQFGERRSLLGLALFNFNPELAGTIDLAAQNFAATGSLDGAGRQGDGSGQALGGIGEATSATTRTAESREALYLLFKDSALYKALSETARQSLETLRQYVSGKGGELWNHLSFVLLPALSEKFAPTLRIQSFTVQQVLVSTEISSSTRLVFNPAFDSEFSAWQRQVQILLKQVEGQRRTLTLSGARHDRRAARQALQLLEERLQALQLQRPLKITAAVSHVNERMTLSVQQVQHHLATLGQNELLAQLQLKARQAAAHAARAKAWVNQELGGALPVLIAGLNIWNTLDSLDKARRDGIFSADELRTVSANAAYTGNALTALWVMPAWQRVEGMSASLAKGRTAELTRAGVNAWRKAGRMEFARIARGLVLRTATWAALGAVAAGVEAWQVSKDIKSATSGEEALMLYGKLGSLISLSILSGAQLVGSILGIWFSFAWVMAPWIMVIVAILGILYLATTLFANRYKREGLRLWLHRCSWGHNPQPDWSSGESGHAEQLRSLAEILLRPSLLARGVSRVVNLGTNAHGPYRTEWQGFWVELILPASLAGQNVTLQPAMVDSGWFRDDIRRQMEKRFYHQWLDGHWVAPGQAGQLPREKPGNQIPGDHAYSRDDSVRIWRAWISYSHQPILELEVSYPQNLVQRSDGRGYLFRLAIENSAEEAERKNTPFSQEPSADMVLSKGASHKIALPIVGIIEGKS